MSLNKKNINKFRQLISNIMTFGLVFTLVLGVFVSIPVNAQFGTNPFGDAINVGQQQQNSQKAKVDNCGDSIKSVYTCKITGYDNRSANIVIANNKVVGIKDCTLTRSQLQNAVNTGGTGQDSGQSVSEQNCNRFLIDGLNIGDNFDKTKIENKQFGILFAAQNDSDQGIRAKDNCPDSKPIENGKFTAIRCGQGQNGIYLRDNTTLNYKFLPNAELDNFGNNGLSASDKGDLAGPNAKQVVDAGLDANQAEAIANAYKLRVQSEATGKIKCDPPYIDKQNSKLIFSCKEGEKFVNPKGEALNNGCAGVTVSYDQVKEADVKFDDSCLSATQLSALKSDSTNIALGSKPDTSNDTDDKGTPDPSPVSATNLLSSLGSVMAVIFFYLVYIFGWIGSILLWWLGIIFINILAINPASPDFIGAALRPWQILTGLANLLILATFIMVGFGYILNIKSLKRNIQEFLLQISIFALLLNFTLLGTAVVVNLAQGIGDVMIYTTVGAKNGRPNRELLIDGFIRGLNRISYVRCGIYRENASMETQEPDACKNSADAIRRGRERGALTTVTDQAGDFGRGIANFNSRGGLDFGGILTNAGVQSNVLRMTLLESLFLFVVIYALVQLWNGLSLVMFRLIGLWLLMVTSPVALALYFLPVKSLSKYANEWMDKFWRSTFFYPFFVLALVLHMRLVEALSLAVYQPGFLPDGATVSTGGNSSSGNPAAFGGSIEVYAATDQQLWRTAIITLVSGSILAFIAIGTFSLIIKFFRDTFGAIVSAVAKSVGAAWGAFRGATYLAGGIAKGGLGILGKGADLGVGAIGGLKDNKWQTREGLRGFVGKKLAKVGEGAQNWNKSKGSLGNILRKAGDWTDNVITSPIAGIDTALWLGKETWDSFKRNTKARALDKRLRTANRLEYGLRKSGAADAMASLGYDIDTNKALNTLAGTSKDEIWREEAQNKDLYKNQFRDLREKQVQDTQGIPDKFRNRDQASARLRTIADKLEVNGGNISQLSSKERQDFARIVSKADDDAALAQELYTNKNTVAAVTQAYQQNILDQKSIQSLQTKFLHALPEKELMEAAQNLDDIESEKVPSYVFNDSNVFDAATRSRMSQDKLKQKLAANPVSQYAVRETQKEINKVIGESKDALVVQATTQGLRELTSQKIDAAGETILRTISDSDLAGKSKVQLTELAKERYRNQASIQQFGIQLEAGDTAQTITQKVRDLANDSNGWEALQNSDASVAAIRGMTNWSTLNNQQKKETIIRVNANAASAVQENFDSYMSRLGDGLYKHALGKSEASVATSVARNAYQMIEEFYKDNSRQGVNFDVSALEALQGNPNITQIVGATAYVGKLSNLSAGDTAFAGMSNLYKGESVERRRQIQDKMRAAVAHYQQNINDESTRFQMLEALASEINERRLSMGGVLGDQVTFNPGEFMLELQVKGADAFKKSRAFVGADGNALSALEHLRAEQEAAIKSMGQEIYTDLTASALVDLKGNYKQNTGGNLPPEVIRPAA